MTMKEPPLGREAFADLIDRGLLYADKTEYISKLISRPKRSHILLRPLGFGKTLLLSSISELFSGERKRFKGLWIEGSDYAFPSRPVIFISAPRNAENPRMLRDGLMAELGRNAENLGVKDDIHGSEPCEYFGDIILAVRKKRGEVAILLDDYDAPAKAWDSDPKLALENAKVLGDFLGVLSWTDVSPCVGFCLVAGVAGPSYDEKVPLNDLSLDPEYAAISGFTDEEFDSLFLGPLEEALADYKSPGEREAFATIQDLKERIYNSCGGYSFGGEQRVLNPSFLLNILSSLKDFDKFSPKDFDKFSPSLAPADLLSLIRERMRKRPLDYFTLDFGPYSKKETSQRGLLGTRREIVLFRAGYLTVDRIRDKSISASAESPGALLAPGSETEAEPFLSYYLGFPNDKVSSSYFGDFLRELFGKGAEDELKANGERLREAILLKQSKVVGKIIESYFSAFYKSSEGVKTKNYHVTGKTLLSIMGFKILEDVPGSDGNPDLCAISPSGIYLVIEIRDALGLSKLTREDEDAALSKAATDGLKFWAKSRYLSDAVSVKFGFEGSMGSPPKGRDKRDKKGSQNMIPLRDSYKILTLEERTKAMAAAARKEFSEGEIKNILNAAAERKKISDSKIAQVLNGATENAVLSLSRSLGGPGDKEKEPLRIIPLLLSVHNDGVKVKAFFGSSVGKIEHGI
jgi:hypothetical protein